MKKNIYLTEKGLEIDLNDFSEVNAHLQSDNLLKADWEEISKYQKLSEAFIEKYADKVDWTLISKYQKLSEPFIEKYADKVDWGEISEYQELSEPFIEKFEDKLFFEDKNTIIVIKSKNIVTYISS